jgi:hypothetical protein
MRCMRRQLEEQAKLPDEITLDALGAAVPHTVVQAVVAELGVAEPRRRKLPAEVGLLLSVAMNLFTQDSLDQVRVKRLQGLRFIWPDPTFVPASQGAVCQARYRLGAQPTVALCHRVCQPLATTATPGAVLFGLRLMAIDGSTEDVPDTLANVSVFGRHTGPRGVRAFPQGQGVYLLACGTHAIVDAGFWPWHTSERLGGRRLLRAVTAGMRLLWDRGFHSFDMARRTRARGAHFLGRVPSHVHFKPLRRLADGSDLADISPAAYQRRKGGERLLVRVIESTFTDPALPGYGERHRLLTALLEAKHSPALELIWAYHERWEIEVAIAEIATPQRLVRHPRRSQKPVGVIQELSGLLIAHYAVRRVMPEAAMRAGIDPDRLSFSNAVRLVCDAIPACQMVAPAQQPQLYARLLRDMARSQLPERHHRNHPRVVKRKMSNFHLKRAAHRQWPQLSKPFRTAVALVN